jgi:hypothetical protein
MFVGADVWRVMGWGAIGAPFVGMPEVPFSALRSQSALPSAGAAAGMGGNCGAGVPYEGVGCEAGGTAPGLLNCASRAARLAVGVPDGAGAAAGGIGVDMGGGNWNGGG